MFLYIIIVHNNILQIICKMNILIILKFNFMYLPVLVSFYYN